MSFVDLAKPFSASRVRRIVVLIPAIGVATLFTAVNPSTLMGDDDDRERETVRRDTDREQPRRDSDQPRSEGDRERGDGDRERRASERERGDAGEFRPQTDREEALFRLIQQLRREVEALRREVRGSSDRAGDRRRDVPREGDARSREGSRDRDRNASARNASDAARLKAAKVFAAYDKNKDKQVSFEEWVAMKEGDVEGERLAREKQWFAQADRSRDERLSLEEFFAWMNRGRAASREGAARRSRDKEETRREQPREGDRPDGDRPREGAERD
ncbi:MAG: hypothetical protein CMJ64_24095 [Planctomycetaceae bacterium]|nr:hypothetical protein [Planctomycetaceae bacterium]